MPSYSQHCNDRHFPITSPFLIRPLGIVLTAAASFSAVTSLDAGCNTGVGGKVVWSFFYLSWVATCNSVQATHSGYKGSESPANAPRYSLFYLWQQRLLAWCKKDYCFFKKANNAKLSHNALKQEKSWNTSQIRYTKSTIFQKFSGSTVWTEFFLAYVLVFDMMRSIFTRYGLFSLFHWAYSSLTEIGSVSAVRDILELGILSQKYFKELVVYMCNLTLVWCQAQKKSCHAVLLVSREDKDSLF